MKAPPVPPSVQAYAPEFARRVGLIVSPLIPIVLRCLAGCAPHLATPLWSRLLRIASRFERLMARLVAGRLPEQRRFPHTGGRPHPENLLRGSPLPQTNGWLFCMLGWEVANHGCQLQALLAEPAAAELLALVPAAGRILRPLRHMLGLGPFDPTRRRRANKPVPAAELEPPPPPPPLGRLIGTSPGGMTWYRLPTRPLRFIRHNIV